MPRVGIVGAGIIGLNTAICIQKDIPDVEVTVIAEHFQECTTSYSPPGLFRPHGVNAASENDAAKWIDSSWNHFFGLYCSSEAAIAGISQISGYVFSNEDPELPEAKQYRDVVPNYRQLSGKELDNFGGPWRYGAFHSTLVIEPSIHLPYLVRQYVQTGGSFIPLAVLSLSDLVDKKYDVIVNCSGLGAKKLVNDEEVFPVRGQLVRVEAPWVREFYMAENTTYIYPNRNNVVLGGVRQPNDWSCDVRPDETQGILDRCSAVLPSLQNAPIVNEFAGLRPGRSTIRLECDMIPLESDKSIEVVHNYGHGGNGISLSWGCAAHAARLVKEMLAVKDL